MVAPIRSCRRHFGSVPPGPRQSRRGGRRARGFWERARGGRAGAASGLAAADLWEQRSGRSQDVAVDLRQATAALRSALYLRLGNGPVPDERSPIMGVYPTKDERWAYIHSAFPNHFAAALKVLDCEGNRVAVTKALAGWNALGKH